MSVVFESMSATAAPANYELKKKILNKWLFLQVFKNKVSNLKIYDSKTSFPDLILFLRIKPPFVDLLASSLHDQRVVH